MMNEKKGITVKVDAQLHAQVRQYLEQNDMTMADFVTKALQDELQPKEEQEEKGLEKMRTLAFQVPEDLFQQIKDYLRRNNMTQRQFVIGLIEDELQRDQEQRQKAPAQTEEEQEDVSEEFADPEPEWEEDDEEAQPEQFEDEEQAVAAMMEEFEDEAMEQTAEDILADFDDEAVAEEELTEEEDLGLRM